MVGAKILANEAQMQYLATIWRLPISTNCAKIDIIFPWEVKIYVVQYFRRIDINFNLAWK